MARAERVHVPQQARWIKRMDAYASQLLNVAVVRRESSLPMLAFSIVKIKTLADRGTQKAAGH